MPGDQAPGLTENTRLTPEGMGKVLSIISRRLGWIQKKMDRYGSEKLNLTVEELDALQHAITEFDPAMRAMDSV